MKKELTILIVFVLLWCTGFVAAPLFSASFLSNGLYRFYSVVCHQFDSRSFHIHGDQFAVCIRCTSIYAGFLFALITLRLSLQLRTKNFNPFLVLIISSLPMFIDGSASLMNFYDSTTVSRIMTGFLFGIGMALLLHQPLTGIIHSHLKKIKIYELETR